MASTNWVVPVVNGAALKIGDRISSLACFDAASGGPPEAKVNVMGTISVGTTVTLEPLAGFEPTILKW